MRVSTSDVEEQLHHKLDKSPALAVAEVSVRTGNNAKPTNNPKTQIGADH